MNKRETYIDKYGYYRFNNNNKLVHREIAYKCLYNNQFKYTFNSYQVHHIDRNKLNNKVTNLQIVTRKEHLKVHGLLTEGVSKLLSLTE